MIICKSKTAPLCFPAVFSPILPQEAFVIDGGAEQKTEDGSFWSWLSWLNPATWFGTTKVSTSWYISWSGKSLGEGITKDNTLGSQTGTDGLLWRVFGWVITQLAFNYRISRN